MSIFQCQHCGCAENTALTSGHMVFLHDGLDFTGMEERKGKRLCSACTPSHNSDGDEVRKGGKWHGQFDRVFLAMGEFETDNQGNLRHIATGRNDYRNMAHEKD